MQRAKQFAEVNGVRDVGNKIDKVAFFNFWLSDQVSGVPIMLTEYLNEMSELYGVNSFDSITYDPVAYQRALAKTEKFIGVGNKTRRGEWMQRYNAAAIALRATNIVFATHTLNNAANFQVAMFKALDSPKDFFKFIQEGAQIAAQTAAFNVLKIKTNSLVLSGLYSLLYGEDEPENEEEKLNELNRAILSAKSKEEKEILEAEVKYSKELLKLVNKRGEKAETMRLIGTIGNDTFQNLFVFGSAVSWVIPTFLSVYHDEESAKMFKDNKEHEQERLKKEIKNAKRLGEYKKAAELMTELNKIDSQLYIEASPRYMQEIRDQSAVGLTSTKFQELLKSTLKNSPSEFSGNKLMVWANFMGLGQQDLKRVFDEREEVIGRIQQRDEEIKKIREKYQK
jgi:hypothetical protein